MACGGLALAGECWAVPPHDQGALASAAANFLADLCRTVGENVYLRMREGLQAETIAITRPTQGCASIVRQGHGGCCMPARAGCCWRMRRRRCRPRFWPSDCRALPPRRGRIRNWIAADLQRIRARGYLITADEVHPGAVSITAPVRDGGGQVVAALTISGASMRMRPPRPRSLLPQLLDSAQRLSEQLGWHPPPGSEPIREKPATLMLSGRTAAIAFPASPPR